MGKRGPKPKSAKLESAQGFPGRRKSKTTAAIIAAELPEPADADQQHELSDSLFVQPPPYLIGKRERAVWVEIFAGPNARLWFKFSDHNVIARYCQLTVLYRQLTKVLPKATYKTRSTIGGDVMKRNPAFDQMLALSRELRSIEDDIAGNPGARLALESKGLGPAKAKPAGGDGTAAPPAAGKPQSPLGVLKAKSKMN